MASLSVPRLTLGSELFPGAAGAQSSAGRQRWGARSEPYHELGVAILEGAPRVPVALLLPVHHAALHGVLDLGESRVVHGSPRMWPRESAVRPGRAAGLCLRKGSLCAGPCLPSLSQSLSVPFTGTSTPRKRATALPACRQAAEGTGVHAVQASPGPRLTPWRHRSVHKGPWGAQHVCGARSIKGGLTCYGHGLFRKGPPKQPAQSLSTEDRQGWSA